MPPSQEMDQAYPTAFRTLPTPKTQNHMKVQLIHKLRKWSFVNPENNLLVLTTHWPLPLHGCARPPVHSWQSIPYVPFGQHTATNSIREQQMLMIFPVTSIILLCLIFRVNSNCCLRSPEATSIPGTRVTENLSFCSFYLE